MKEISQFGEFDIVALWATQTSSHHLLVPISFLESILPGASKLPSPNQNWEVLQAGPGGCHWSPAGPSSSTGAAVCLSGCVIQISVPEGSESSVGVPLSGQSCWRHFMSISGHRSTGTAPVNSRASRRAQPYSLGSMPGISWGSELIIPVSFRTPLLVAWHLGKRILKWSGHSHSFSSL